MAHLRTQLSLLSIALAVAAPACIADDDSPERGALQSATGTCEARCGDYDEAQTCQCDPECTEWGDCCNDYAPLCVGCTYNGVRRPVGATFPAGDGCNSCMCAAPGVVACTDKACNVCEYAGAFYLPGETFLAADGCVTCTCTADGKLECTNLPCSE